MRCARTCLPLLFLSLLDASAARAGKPQASFRILAVKAAKHPARATIDIVYQQISDGHYNGRGVKFFYIHGKPAISRPSTVSTWERAT